ncbi:MAG TPA: HEAT repeat domain-containing protein, partial [Thermoanaerobaculia bacterium]
MRKLAPAILLLALACTTTPPAPVPAAAPQPSAAPEPDHGMTTQEEARILALEDRREYDPAFVAAWVKHPNPLHRIRIAAALGRIGAHAFIDTTGDGFLDTSEKRAGLDELNALSSDPDRRVREMVAFSLGEMGDVKGASTLFYLTGDADAAVAAEAAEALSKLATDKVFVREQMQRYLWLLDAKWPEGVRARAARFLFRFDNDTASEAALRALGTSSAAIRQEAAYALSRRAYAPAREQLQLLLTDPNVLTRAYAIAALGRIGEAQAAPAIVAALGDAHPWVRTNAAVALGRIAEKSRDILRPEDLPRIFAAAEDADPGVRASMIDTLGYYAESNETARTRLLEVLHNGSQWERELAAGAVAKHFDASSETWKQLTNLPAWSTVRVIEATAAKPNGADVRRTYATSSEPMVRAAAIGAIPDDRADAEIELIRAAMNDPDVIVRANAYERYGFVTKEDPDRWLQTLRTAEERERKSEMNDARIAAIAAIAQFEDDARGPWLRSLLRDADPVVRRNASDLIAKTEKLGQAQYAPLPVQRPAAEYEEIVRWSQQPHTATIHMTRGVIQLALLTQDAPMTTWNFAQLARRKYFDRSSFMRVVPNFVVQGGDPRNDMNGGPGYAIRDEINLQKFTRGAVGMALSGPDTGGSQFFITYSPQPHLDGGYTIFGRVYEGMTGVVDQIERGDRVETITIDEHPPVGAETISGVANVSLPLVIGPTDADALLRGVPEYAERKSGYKPDATVLEMVKDAVKPGDRIEVFMGTWCSDSQREVPKFLRILDELKTQGVTLPASFVAVDRAKEKPANLLAGKR